MPCPQRGGYRRISWRSGRPVSRLEHVGDAGDVVCSVLREMPTQRGVRCIVLVNQGQLDAESQHSGRAVTTTDRTEC
jgi:hypothetical protein